MSTIIALASPPGTGAISLLRLSGPKAFSILSQSLGHTALPKQFKPRVACLSQLKKRNGRILDQALITVFPSPASFTGEDTVEIACHGGMLLTQRIIDHFIEYGATPAQPGEFSQRAFLNGKIDLTQAEAIMDLIGAQSDLALQAAHEQLEGHLGQTTKELQSELLRLLAFLEAYIDFPEEDIDPQTGGSFLETLDHLILQCQKLLSTADTGRVLREGLRTVIYGAPNVGKSSLLNLLLGTDRSIVTATAGTTRDTIEETINFHGIPLRLIDTAGIRETEDHIESLGIKRSHSQIANSDLLLEVVDASQPRSSSPPQANPPSSEKRHLLILNKVDLGIHPDWKNLPHSVSLSCHKKTGLEELQKAIETLTKLNTHSFAEHTIAINARHQQCLQTALTAFQNARPLLIPSKGIDPELAAIDLREALEFLGQIAGHLDHEELLGEIFSNFCIGK